MLLVLYLTELSLCQLTSIHFYAYLLIQSNKNLTLNAQLKYILPEGPNE